MPAGPLFAACCPAANSSIATTSAMTGGMVILVRTARIHHQHHRRIGAAALGMDDKNFHRAVLGGDVDRRFDHGAFSRESGRQPSMSDRPRQERAWAELNQRDGCRQFSLLANDERWIILHYGDCGVPLPRARD